MSQRLSDYEPLPGGAKRPKRNVMQPIIVGLALALGVYIGISFGSNTLFQQSSDTENPNKLVNIINYIDEFYVDSVKKKELVDDAIVSILENLDPHSYYISAEELMAVNEQMEGNFEGIGVEFMIQNDTLVVVTPISGGPSEDAGILPGDKIITVNGELLSGRDLTNEKVMKSLKGDRGTKVDLAIKRRGQKELLNFSVTRARIPIHSVVASFMVSEDVGYVKVTRFAKNTYEEFKHAVEGLREEGAKNLVLDLRANGGGYLEPAIDMAAEFLGKDQLVVYTEGRRSTKNMEHTSRDGKYRDMQLVVLINQGSASASEVVAGALQDWDRSITVGRRSFGKGLVQNQIPLEDHSAIRLTIARYFTPTGRCIQKPYGEEIDYDSDYLSRYDRGELLSADSIVVADSLRCVTPGGRIVYGGGGIIPDIFVPMDTTGTSDYLAELSYQGLIREFGFDYTDKHRNELSKFSTVQEFERSWSVSGALLDELGAYADSKGVKRDNLGLTASRDVIANRLKAHIAKNVFDEQAYYYVTLQNDADFIKGMEVVGSYDEFFLASLKSQSVIK
jgi:carboxyl-terminal processing protease